LEERSIERQKFRNSLNFGFLYLLIIILVKLLETVLDVSFARFGVLPLEWKGLAGIILAPLIHGSWEHLINNSMPLLVLSTALFYFYREVAFKVFFLVYFIHGFWLWFFARGSYHIGASGIIYGVGSFLFVSGLIRKNSHMLAISLLVAFLYGSMVWGIFPLVEGVSWEGHLMGMASGMLLAFYYKEYGPAPNIGRWKYDQSDEHEDDSGEDEYWKIVEDQTEKERGDDNTTGKQTNY
jgi:membrane associated rhomboid family serine protease